MYDTPHAIDTLLAMLAAGPARLAEFTAGLSPAQLVASPVPGEWSARDVLAHLRACGDVWGRCIVVILNEDRPTIRAMNPRTWIAQTDYLELPFDVSLQALAAQRAELVALLEPLPDAAWSRAATVTGAGRPLEKTLYSYASGLAIHERPHLKQIQRIAAALRA
jgi:hypothetical protein